MKKMPGDIILLYIHVYHNEDHMICGSWNIRCNRQKFLLFQDIFLALSDPWHPEKSKFYHWEKTPGDIIILLMCTKNGNHMMNVPWDIKHNRQNILSFWTILCPFTQKIKILKKNEKNAWKYYYFAQVWHKWQSYDQGIIQTKMAIGIWFWVPNLDLSPKYD